MIKMKIGSKNVEVDGVELQMDTKPFLKDSRTFVPIRFVAEGMGLNVEWNNDTQEVTIYGRKKYFESADACAFDWAMYWNAMSIALFKEMGGIIYRDENGYYWDDVKIGKDKEVLWSIPEVRKGVAFIHSHGGGDHWTTKSMSKDDFKVSEDCKRPLYMVNSGGHLYKCDPTGEKKQIGVTDGLPCDARWMDIDLNADLMSVYFKHNYQDLKEFGVMGIKADFYNKLFMNKLKYTDEVAVV